MPAFDPNAYETVDSRIKRFYQDHPTGRINTELVGYEGPIGGTRWIVKASVWRSGESIDPDGTDYAFEVDGGRGANATAALENCSTSAVGRCLANIGYSGDKRASREEMGKARPAAAPPNDLLDRVAKATTLDALNAIFEQAGSNRPPELMSALTARKAELS
jgi:hypothetical protein